MVLLNFNCLHQYPDLQTTNVAFFDIPFLAREFYVLSGALLTLNLKLHRYHLSPDGKNNHTGICSYAMSFLSSLSDYLVSMVHRLHPIHHRPVRVPCATASIHHHRPVRILHDLHVLCWDRFSPGCFLRLSSTLQQLFPNMWPPNVVQKRGRTFNAEKMSSQCGDRCLPLPKTWIVFSPFVALFFALRQRSPIGNLFSTTLVFAHDADRDSGTTSLPMW